MNKCIGALLCIVLLFGSFTTPVRAGSDQNQVLIAQLQAMIILLQQQLQVLQAKEMNAIDKELSVTQKRFEFGPKRNAMSCDRVGTKLSDGTVACYGLHDYGKNLVRIKTLVVDSIRHITKKYQLDVLYQHRFVAVVKQ